MVHEVVLQAPPTTIPYAAVVKRYAPYVWHVARSVVRDPGLAEDATQEAFVALLARTEPFASEPVLRTWLGRVGCNAALKIVRSRTRRTAREQVVASRREKGDRAMGRDERERDRELRARVDELPPEERAVVRLKYVNGMPQSEIAQVLDCSTGTVSNRVRDALASLRKALARGGLAAVVPALETRLSALEPETAPSTLVPRLLRLEAPASPPPAKGGSPMFSVSKLIVSGVAVAAATLGLTYLLPGLGDHPRTPPASEIARASGEEPAAPRLAGRGGDGDAPSVPSAPSEPVAATSPVPRSPAPARGLRGVVIAPDGAPAAGAIVVVETPIKSGPHRREETATARDGTWELPELPARGRWVVRVRHPGSAPWRDIVHAARVESRLHASWSVRGVILDPRGEPVTGAVVLITRTATGSGGSRLEADAEGRFTIADLDPERHPPESTSFELRHPRYQPARIAGFGDRVGPDGWAFVEIRLEEGARIAGTVRGPDGRPVARARLLLLPAGASPAEFSWRRRELDADERGNFTFSGLPDGGWVLRGRAPGTVLEEPVHVVLAEREQRSLDLSFGPGRTISGRVVDGSGRPVPTAEIACSDVMDTFPMGREHVADDEGRFTFTGLTVERRTFELHLTYLPLLQNVPLEVEVVSESPRAVEVVIRTKGLLPDPEPAGEEEDDGRPVQVLIPSASARVAFPAGN